MRPLIRLAAAVAFKALVAWLTESQPLGSPANPALDSLKTAAAQALAGALAEHAQQPAPPAAAPPA